MALSTATALASSSSTAPDHAPARDPLSKLRAALDALAMTETKGPLAFAAFERELHARFMDIERDVVAAEMAKLDVDADAVVIAGAVHRRVLRRAQTYMTGAREAVIERTLDKDRTDAEGLISGLRSLAGTTVTVPSGGATHRFTVRDLTEWGPGCRVYRL